MKYLRLVRQAVCVCWICASAGAEEPEWKDKIKPFTKGVHEQMRPMTLNYTMNWNGTVNSGRATMVFGKKHESAERLFLTHVHGRSTGVAGGLFPFSFVYNSFTRKGTNEPLVFISQETDHKEKTVIKNIYRKDKVEHTRTNTDKSDGEVKKREHTFEQKSLHDPLSAMLYIRGRALKDGDTVHMALHPFKSAQYAEIKVLGREQHRGRQCIKLDLKIKNIDRETKQLKAYDKMKRSTLWLSDDRDRILIELRSQVFIGDVRMVLKEK